MSLFISLHHLRAHREQKSADVIEDEPIERGADNRDVEHTTLALANAKSNARHKHQDCQNIGENHDGVEKSAVITSKGRK